MEGERRRKTPPAGNFNQDLEEIMEAWEYLKVIYEELKETERAVTFEAYKLRKEKIKTYLWVNLAVLSATGFITKLFNNKLVLILLIVNLFSVSLSLYLFSKEREIFTINPEESYKQVKEILESKKKNPEVLFYISLIKQTKDIIEKGKGSWKNIYRILSFLLIVQFVVITVIFFMEVI